MTILDLDENSLLCVVLFLCSDDIYEIVETCKTFNYIIKNYNNIKRKNKNFKKKDLIPLRQPQPYQIVSSISMIEWAKSHFGFKYGLRHSQFAARRNDLEVLKYLYKDNCPFGSLVWVEAIENENIKMIKWCKSKNIKYSSFVISKAAEVGKLKILKLLDSYDMEFNDDVCDSAIYGGNLNTLKWLINDKGLIFDNFAFAAAAEIGNLTILKYLFYLSQHNLEYGWFDETTCAVAAKNGQFKVLKWLREKQCQWDASTTSFAYMGKYTKIMIWALENGCPIYESVFECLEELGLNLDRNECTIIPN